MTAFVDANIIIKAFTGDIDSERCRSVLYEGFVTDSLCLIEAHESICRISKSSQHASKSIKSLFKGNGLVVPLDQNLLYASFKLDYNRLNSFDAIHYIAALLHNCSEIVSYDRDFDNLPIKRTEP